MTRFHLGLPTRFAMVVAVVVYAGASRPVVGVTQTAAPATRPCDPAHFSLTLSGWRLNLGDAVTDSDTSLENNATIARLRDQTTQGLGPLPFLDLARCYYLTRQLALASGALAQAVETLDKTGPLAGAVPDAWSRLPLAGRDVPRPTKVRDKAAAFAQEAVDLGIRGVVFVDTVIDREGRVRDPRIGFGIPAHDAAALEAVSEWRYAPTLVNGTPTGIATTLLVAFGTTQIRAVDAIDAARFFTTRGHADARGWITHAAGLVATEDTAWTAGRRLATSPPVTQPRMVSKVYPVYPATARAARVQGDVVLEGLVGNDGTVRYARVLRGHPMLHDASIRTVHQWRFEPARVNGESVAIVVTMIVGFRLG